MDSVLVVDREVVVRAEIAAYLRHCGYLVIEAATTDEALAVLEHKRFTVDAVLCDAEAGGAINGFGLARWLREHRPGVRVVLAGSIDKAASAAADLCEEGPHIARPYDADVVSDFIRRRLATRQRNQEEPPEQE